MVRLVQRDQSKYTCSGVIVRLIACAPPVKILGFEHPHLEPQKCDGGGMDICCPQWEGEGVYPKTRRRKGGCVNCIV